MLAAAAGGHGWAVPGLATRRGAAGPSRGRAGPRAACRPDRQL